MTTFKNNTILGKFTMVSQPIDLVCLVVGSGSIDLLLLESLIVFRLNCIISRSGFGDPNFPLIFRLLTLNQVKYRISASYHV
jgi:hypothetical protein